MGAARELIFRAAIYTNMDSKAGMLLPAYSHKVTGAVSVDELLRACDRFALHQPKYDVQPYCTKAGLTEVVNFAMLELLMYQKQHSVKNTVKTVQKLQATLQQSREQQVE